MNALDATSTRPYLVRALYEWCTDNGLTPYVAVAVDETVQVPREYVKNNEIVLNISFDATSSLKLGNDFIEFRARFAGSAREIMVPIGRVIAIYARENGQGMAFPLSGPSSSDPVSPAEAPQADAAGPAATAPALAPASHGSGPEGRIVQLVPTDSSSSSSAPGDGDTEPPEPPKPKQGTRPSLKRVK
ncbi:MAG: ClpXP protease specificity-enhancing factor [Pseudomonadota bacterium]